jgi:hypothetical protein
MKTTVAAEEVSSHPGGKGHWHRKRHRNTSGTRGKTMAEGRKDLKICGARKRITKKAHACRGRTIKREIPNET